MFDIMQNRSLQAIRDSNRDGDVVVAVNGTVGGGVNNVYRTLIAALRCDRANAVVVNRIRKQTLQKSHSS